MGNALTAFAKKYCACWDATRKMCIGVDVWNPHCFNGGNCLLGQGKLCKYFEENVFPICKPSYKFATETAQYGKLLKLYLKLNPNVVIDEAVVRRCGCGAVLKPRQRYCDKCAARRRRESYRRARSKRNS